MQIVGYERAVGGDPAALLLAEDGEVSRQSVSQGERLYLGLGDRHCAGSVEDSAHHSCSRETAPYCDAHTSTWPCARCSGQCAMPVEDCYEDHAIYLAGFAPDTFKVGVTKAWRLAIRLEEQGADRAAHIRSVENGRRARSIEAELATHLSDRVRFPLKVTSLHRDFDDASWETLVADYDVIDRFSFDYGLSLDRQPVLETLAAGTVSGTKGRVLVIERGGTTYAVDMRDLVGHEVTPESASTHRQSSLGAYD